MTVTYFDQNADGVCGIDFKSGIGGYAFNWKIKNGEVQYLDSQPKEPRTDASIYFKYMNTSKEVEFAKIDVDDAKPEVYNKIIFDR